MLGDPQRGIHCVLGLLAEDHFEQSLLRGHLLLTLGSHLPDQDIPGDHFRARTHDTPFVEVDQRIRPHVGNIPRDFLGAHFRVPCLHLKLMDMD